MFNGVLFQSALKMKASAGNLSVNWRGKVKITQNFLLYKMLEDK